MKAKARLAAFLLLISIPILILCGCASGPAGTSVKSARVSGEGHLILTLSDGQTVDAGNVVGPQGPTGPANPSKGSFADIVPKIEPAIVRIDVKVANGLASGSGTLVDKRGYIVTNEHVIAGERGISVTLMDGTVLRATVVASDAVQDLAVIRLTTTRTDFPTVPLGTMADVSVGESVMAAGFPAGTSLPGPATFTAGIVSAFRNYNGIDCIQTDTPVNPGNSGGCLFTMSGSMVGIPAAGIVPANQDFEDINLAVPIDQVAAFVAQHVK